MIIFVCVNFFPLFWACACMRDNNGTRESRLDHFKKPHRIQFGYAINYEFIPFSVEREKEEKKSLVLWLWIINGERVLEIVVDKPTDAKQMPDFDRYNGSPFDGHATGVEITKSTWIHCTTIWFPIFRLWKIMRYNIIGYITIYA